MSTPVSERTAVESYLQDPSKVESIIKYLTYMKKFYELERQIESIYNERTNA